MPLGIKGKKGVCVAVREAFDETYEFERVDDSDPPGQIFAYRVKTFNSPRMDERRRRVLANDLPSSHLRETFVKLTGKTAAEIGVQIHGADYPL